MMPIIIDEAFIFMFLILISTNVWYLGSRCDRKDRERIFLVKEYWTMVIEFKWWVFKNQKINEGAVIEEAGNMSKDEVILDGMI